MNILITGVAGFIGSNFLKFYREKNKNDLIIGVDALTYAGNIINLEKEIENGDIIFYKADIRDRDKVEEIFYKHNVEVVVNFAAESHVDRSIHNPQIFLETNVLGTHTLLEVARKKWCCNGKWDEDKLFLQISTDEVYGSLGPQGYFTEETPLDPHSPYAASKAAADLIVKSYSDTYGMPVNITRCSNNYGPYQFPEKLIPLMIWNALNHKELPIYGDGRQIRDWLHVRDHCEAIELVIKRGKRGEVYNIGGNNEWKNIEIVKKLIKILRQKTGDYGIGEHLIKHVPDRLGHDRRYAIDASKIRKELGWEPKINFEQGINITVEWYLQNIDWVKSVITGEYLEFYNKNYNKK